MIVGLLSVEGDMFDIVEDVVLCGIERVKASRADLGNVRVDQIARQIQRWPTATLLALFQWAQ